MNDQDKSFWDAYTRKVVQSQKVKPTPFKKPTVRSAKPHIPLHLEKSQALTKKSDRNSLSDAASPLERKREKSMRKGEIGIDAKIDLHGMTQIEAFKALQDFIEMQVRMGSRTLLVITGRGRQGEGVLRRSLCGWLDQLPEVTSILALRQAAPCHGGEGAYYILLRKLNKKHVDIGATRNSKI